LEVETSVHGTFRKSPTAPKISGYRVPGVSISEYLLPIPPLP
jgi:hypothetical protein